MGNNLLKKARTKTEQLDTYITKELQKHDNGKLAINNKLSKKKCYITVGT